jgi:hypothetical protein
MHTLQRNYNRRVNLDSVHLQTNLLVCKLVPFVPLSGGWGYA